MSVFVRAVVSGFGFSLGASLYKKVSKRLGLDDKDKKESPDPDTVVADADADGETDRE